MKEVVQYIHSYIYGREDKKERTTHIATHSALHIYCHTERKLLQISAWAEAPHPHYWHHIYQEASKHWPSLRFSCTESKLCVNSLPMVYASLKYNGNFCKSHVFVQMWLYISWVCTLFLQISNTTVIIRQFDTVMMGITDIFMAMMHSNRHFTEQSTDVGSKKWQHPPNLTVFLQDLLIAFYCFNSA